MLVYQRVVIQMFFVQDLSYPRKEFMACGEGHPICQDPQDYAYGHIPLVVTMVKYPKEISI